MHIYSTFLQMLGCFVVATGLLRTHAVALELKPVRGSSYELVITGRVEGLPPNGAAFLDISQLRKLPTFRISITGAFGSGKNELKGLLLLDLLKALPVSPDVDTVLAVCADGYTAIFRVDFIQKYSPFLVLEIDGVGPERWPPPGLKLNPGPVAIAVTSELVPEVERVLDIGHKRPWAVVSLEFASFKDRQRDLFTGPRSRLSSTGASGREIWINSCASCHVGPGNSFGGTKSGRPFEVIVAHARYNRDYFKRYVANPRAMIAGAKMEAHPHYTDEQLESLIEFIVADER